MEKFRRQKMSKLFTLISVACAESITATNSSKLESNSSSVVGAGFVAANILKTS